MAKVLLVEDDAFISDIIETKLTQVGHEVVTTPNGDGVIGRLLGEKIDVLLLDLMLPNKHGFEVLEEIRAEEPLKELPVVILSNENGPDVEARAQGLGAKYYFKAMTDMNELVGIVEGALA